MNKLLTLYHEKVPGHVETWWLNVDKVEITGVYAGNYPAESSHALTGLEALRQFALMTSTEGWVAIDSENWHDFVEALEV